MSDVIDVSAEPSGTGCLECEDERSWWVHLRRCAACGHVGCCDSSLGRHASAHARETGHRLIQSFEPGEDWWWDYASEDWASGPPLAPPTSRPDDQPAPGPAGRVPEDWRQQVRAAGR
ncbi:UBP-type zinc finger domain-containing protein [Microbacterium sp. CFH 90308]|uniref:UBP-type zinc finger domain-containing protein n=1 Tax=Microbacterium salsuginis TaxID=2722803 RepID=A0ABX1KHY8_9MICO|nr:UBP-type zinc finger domain-containing protein [Microbacterium sp. CFH 90308]